MATATEKRMVKDPFGEGLIPAPEETTEPRKAAKQSTPPDQELLVMSRITKQLAKLAPDERRRIGAWLADRYGAK
jgi:hypothetical protein